MVGARVNTPYRTAKVGDRIPNASEVRWWPGDELHPEFSDNGRNARLVGWIRLGIETSRSDVT
jgi:hypothetical protein